MPVRLQPAFWGGLFIGVLSALPFISILNACCCLWVITGGILAAYLAQERSHTPIAAGDGAIVGLAAGAIGAVISWVLGLGVSAMQGGFGPAAFDDIAGRGDMPPEISRLFDQMRDLPVAFWILAPLLVAVIVFPIVSMLGGLLGVAIFKKRLPPAPPDTFDATPVQ